MRLTLAFILALPLAAAPTEIPITGTAWFGAITAHFQLSGAGISLYSDTFDWSPGPGCTFGEPCDMSITIPSDYDYCHWCWDGSSGNVNGVAADKISGALTFTTAPITVTLADYNQARTVALTVSGDVQGNTVGHDQDGLFLIPQWSLQIAGSGTGQIWLNGRPEVDAMNYNFTGTATELPEPSSFSLFGIGLAALLLP